MASFTEIPHDDKVQMLVDFRDCKPPIFTGRWKQLMDWLKEIKGLLEYLDVLEEQRVPLACMQLKGCARRLWEKGPARGNMGWTQFENTMLQTYDPLVRFIHWEAKVVDWVQLNAELIQEYTSHFYEDLLIHCPYKLGVPEKKRIYWK